MASEKVHKFVKNVALHFLGFSHNHNICVNLHHEIIIKFNKTLKIYEKCNL